VEADDVEADDSWQLSNCAEPGYRLLTYDFLAIQGTRGLQTPGPKVWHVASLSLVRLPP
jgi:hypothetical protein